LPLQKILFKLPCIIYSHKTKAWRKSNFNNIKPPGDIIRPKSLNKRGRPRKIHSDSPIDFYPHQQCYHINNLEIKNGLNPY
jgi:hypothetical protein